MKRQSVPPQDADEGDFFVSMAVAMATDDWMIGAMVGGSLSGAIVGDALVDSEPEPDYQEHTPNEGYGGGDSDSADSGGYDSGDSDFGGDDSD